MRTSVPCMAITTLEMAPITFCKYQYIHENHQQYKLFLSALLNAIGTSIHEIVVIKNGLAYSTLLYKEGGARGAMLPAFIFRNTLRYKLCNHSVRQQGPFASSNLEGLLDISVFQRSYSW
jgi:hypothetical protein